MVERQDKVTDQRVRQVLPGRPALVLQRPRACRGDSDGRPPGPYGRGLPAGRKVVAVHRRSFGDSRSDTADYPTSLETLLRRLRAWPNSPFRARCERATPRRARRVGKAGSSPRAGSALAESIAVFGLEVALESLDEAVRRQTLDAFSLQALSNRIAFDGLLAAPDEGPDLGAYDRTLIGASHEKAPGESCRAAWRRSPASAERLAFSQTAVRLCVRKARAPGRSSSCESSRARSPTARRFAGLAISARRASRSIRPSRASNTRT